MIMARDAKKKKTFIVITVYGLKGKYHYEFRYTMLPSYCVERNQFKKAPHTHTKGKEKYEK